MHPLVTDLKSLSDEEITNKINDLYARLRTQFASRNPAVRTQLTSILDDYMFERQRRAVEQRQKFSEQNKDLDSKINIK
jgi:hypothetical protein